MDTLPTAKPIAILVNPLSGNGRSLRVANDIEAMLESKAIVATRFDKDWPAQLDQFSEAWVIGGDGTVNFFLNNYKQVVIPVAFFRAGTGNDIHWKLYGDMELDEQVEKVLQAEPVKIDAGLCNAQIYLNSAGIGFDGEVLRSMGTIRWMGGHLGYLWIVIRKIFSYREPAFTIRWHDQTIRDRFLLVAVNNSSRTGGGFLVTPRAAVTDGLLDMVLCKAIPLIKRLRYLPVIEKGKHLDLPFITYKQLKEVTIEAERTLYAQLDGELISGRSFVFKVLPGFLAVKY